MSALAMVSFSSPQIGLAALALAIAAAGIAIVRRIDVPIMSAMLLAAGVISLAMAAGGPVWHRSEPGTIAVMVDLSPSTRGARFRDADFLRRRARELIGDSARQFFAFADHNVAIDPAKPMEEMPADQTRFSPAAADAIVLFSDARFDLPKSSPPVYVAVDENLENVSDASVQRLELRGRTLAATIANSGPPREASLEGTTGSPTARIDPGNLVIARPIAGGATTAGVKLNAGAFGRKMIRCRCASRRRRPATNGGSARIRRAAAGEVFRLYRFPRSRGNISLRPSSSSITNRPIASRRRKWIA